MSATHEVAVPRLHLTLRDTRRELDAIRELAVELAVALDREVDARLKLREPDRAATRHALYRAREAGLL